MAWDASSRHQHRRASSRYPSDMTDREWAVIAPLLHSAKPGGRPRRTDLRAVMNAILYIAAGGCQWRMLLKDFPPRSTMHGYFDRWLDRCLVAERCWDGVRWAIKEYAQRFDGLRRYQSSRRARCCSPSIRMPAPPPLSAPRSPAPRRAPASWRAATVSPARPSASGANAVRPTVRTAQRGRTSCPGRRARRSAPSSAPCAAPPASRSTISPSFSRTSCRI